MKKSEVYHMAQIAVIQSETIHEEEKLEILRILFQNEDIEIWTETKKKEKENGKL